MLFVMENKNFILCLFAGLAFGNNSMIASKDNVSNESTINNTKSQDDNKFSEIKNRDQHTKNLNDKKEESDKLQWGIASQNFSINFNLKNVESSLKKKLNDKEISGDVLSVEGDFMMSFLKDITYKRAFPATFGDASTFCDDKKIMIFSDTEKWKKTGGEVLSWFLDVERELSIYGYKITQRTSPLSVKSDAGYRVNLFSVKNVFNVLNRLSYTSLNPGCMDFLNVSIMRTDAYLKEKKGFSTEGRKLVELCIDVFSVNKKFSDSLEIGFLFGTHYNLSDSIKLTDLFATGKCNLAFKFSLNYTCKYIFMNFKLIGYNNKDNKIMSNGRRNIYLDYFNEDSSLVTPVKIKLGSSILKGKRVAAFGRNSLICKDICLDIKSDLFNIYPYLFSYDLSLCVSLEKYIDFTVGICSHDKKGLPVSLDNVARLKSVSDTSIEYNRETAWIYLPIPYLKIQINWLELRK